MLQLLQIVKLQTTPGDGAGHGEGEAEAQGTGDEEHNATTWDRQGTGMPIEAGRGGGMRVRWIEVGRGRGPLYGTTLGTAQTWAQVEDDKGGNLPGEGRRGLCEELLGPPQKKWEGSADEGWRPVGGSAVQVDD